LILEHHEKPMQSLLSRVILRNNYTTATGIEQQATLLYQRRRRPFKE